MFLSPFFFLEGINNKPNLIFFVTCLMNWMNNTGIKVIGCVSHGTVEKFKHVIELTIVKSVICFVQND